MRHHHKWSRNASVQRAAVVQVDAKAKGFGNIMKPAAPKDLLQCVRPRAPLLVALLLRCCGGTLRVPAPSWHQALSSRMRIEHFRNPVEEAQTTHASHPCTHSTRLHTRGREPLRPHTLSPKRDVPPHIQLPPYASSGMLPGLNNRFEIHDEQVLSAVIAKPGLIQACAQGRAASAVCPATPTPDEQPRRACSTVGCRRQLLMCESLHEPVVARGRGHALL
jgi:hypothetical protein